jgi:hypothetical protein
MTRSILFSVPSRRRPVFSHSGPVHRTRPRTQDRMSVAEIATMLEAQGYTVLEIELEHGRYDVEMTDANGMRLEAWLDPATGEVLPYADDDDDDDDDDAGR